MNLCKGFNCMPDITRPIDDNTLFILLALRQNGYIEIPSIISVYDWNVNYDDTQVIFDDTPKTLEEIGAAGVEFIVDNFGVVKEEQEQKVILSAPITTQISGFLSEYLKDFSHNSMFYYDEKKHCNRLYEFIKYEEPDVLNFEGKYFTYKLLPKKNREKFKMIEYLAHLIEKGYLIADDKTFEFYTEQGIQRKSIRLKFESQEKVGLLFLNKFNEIEQKRILQDLKNKKPVIESEKWAIYSNRIIYKPFNLIGDLPNRYLNLLKYCIKKGNSKIFNSRAYANEIGISEQAVRGYCSEIHKEIQKSFNSDRKIVLLKSIGSGQWEIDV